MTYLSRHVALAIGFGLLLSGCGGGGDDDDASTQPVPTTTFSVVTAVTGAARDEGPQDGIFDLAKSPPTNDRIFANNGFVEDRFAVEYDLSLLPGNIDVVTATLNICVEHFDPDNNVWEMEVHGFKGDGSLQLADFAVDNFLDNAFADVSGANLLKFDVTDNLRQALANADNFAGYNLRQLFVNGYPNITLKVTGGCGVGAITRLDVEYM